MSSLMTLTTGYIKDIRRGRWMLVCKAPEQKDHAPQWQMYSIDAVMGDHLMIATEDQLQHLEAINNLDNHATFFSVRETEPLKSIFLKSGSIQTICNAVRDLYNEHKGLPLSQVLEAIRKAAIA